MKPRFTNGIPVSSRFAVLVLSAVASAGTLAGPLSVNAELTDYAPVIVAGVSPDSPSNRVDANVVNSAFAGVGSLRLFLPGTGTFICSGTAVSPIHVVTAGHCLDLAGSDGQTDLDAGNVTFNVNAGGSPSQSITARQLVIHPDYTGFNNPNVNDDIAVVVLDSPLAPGVPIYGLQRNPVAAGTTFSMVGYGRSGNPSGYTTGASFTVKRAGANNADFFIADDDGSLLDEVFLFDFDGSSAATNLFGPNIAANLSLGNDVETTLGGGDSGGASFVSVDGELLLAGVNTFVFSALLAPPDNPEGSELVSPPNFGSGGGGILVPAYSDWIDGVIATTIPIPAGIWLLAAGLVPLAGFTRRH